MGALAGVVAFMLLLNTSLPFVNSLGVADIQFAYSTNVNQTALQQMGGCTNNGTSCGVNLGQQNPLTTAITFGDFLWGAANFLTQIPIAIALPAFMLTQDFYAPVAVAALYNVAMWIIFAFWINDYVSGRYHMSIP